MGSGVGISLYGTHRVAGERYRFAMPETGIGLFPDDGVSWAFARMPDEIGMYLALTGRAIGRADAYRLGLVHALHSRLLASSEIRGGAQCRADTVDPLLDDRHEDPGPGELEPCAAHRALLLRGQRGGHPRAPAGRARRCGNMGASGPRGASQRARRPRSRSPIAMFALARSLDLRATLQQDFRLACRCLEATTSTRACGPLLIDRDRAPKWQPATLTEVSEPWSSLFRPARA